MSEAGTTEPTAPTEPAAPESPALLYGCPVTEPFGQRTVHTDRDRYLPLMEGLHKDGFEACLGVAGVDYLTHPGRDLPTGVEAERFEVVAELLSFSKKERLRVAATRSSRACSTSGRAARLTNARLSTCSGSSSATIPT
jgi:NADH:ubiquinone oxidoreductase subunit C